MTEVLQANIFFLITSVAVVVVGLLLAAVLVYVLLIVRNVKSITDRLKEGSELIANDIAALRGRIGAFGAALVGRLFAGPRRRRAKRSESKEDEV